MSRVQNLVLASAALVVLLIGGCTDVPVVDDGLIVVRVINNTDFDIDPAIEFGRSSNALVALNLGILAPGEVLDVDFDCDEIDVLTTTESTQFGSWADYVLDPLPIFELDYDYFCGELIVFEFVGNELDFDVFVDAGGENIY